MPRLAHFQVTPEDRQRLQALLAAPLTPQKHVWRCAIVLATAEGLGTMEIMRRTGKGKVTVWRWQDRYVEAGVEGLLHDRTRPPGKPPTCEEKVQAVLTRTLEPPPDGTSHWTCRRMAQAVGLDHTTVHRIWRQHGLAPHRCRQFKISTDPNFARKAREVMGLYMAPPAHALVLSVDEKTQIQALQRTQPSLPLQPGHPATQTHDYIRHGTTTLFAALHVQTGQVTAQTQARHRPQACLAFLDHLAADSPTDTPVHVILDNYATHKTADVHTWLDAHPDWHFHFIPTSSSWMNAVEGLFAKLARGCLQRGNFASLQDLVDTMHQYLQAHNRQSARPFRWRKDPEEIMAARKRGYHKLETMH